MRTGLLGQLTCGTPYPAGTGTGRGYRYNCTRGATRVRPPHPTDESSSAARGHEAPTVHSTQDRRRGATSILCTVPSGFGTRTHRPTRFGVLEHGRGSVGTDRPEG